jgi:hypothetical protein
LAGQTEACQGGLRAPVIPFPREAPNGARFSENIWGGFARNGESSVFPQLREEIAGVSDGRIEPYIVEREE